MKILFPAAAALLLAASTASAQPPLAQTSPVGQLTSPDVIQVQRRDRDDDARRGRDDNHRFTPGRRYRESPPGWRRHGYRRPGDWRTRGCILVGPLWFCP